MVTPRTATLVSLAALPAVGYYALVSDPRVVVSVVNVLLITAALYLAFGPHAGGGHDHGDEHAPEQS
ncbi:MAG: hypothetical protein ABEH61_03525 [Haloarculaceae archaeon]